MGSGPGSWESAYQRKPSSGYGRGGHHSRAPSLARLFGERGLDSILDLGCGDGANLVFFARSGFTVSGLDCAPTALRLAREWLAREGLECDLRCGDMEDLPWPQDSFDAVISVKVINHNTAAGAERAFVEVARVLRPGGYFFATVAAYPPSEQWLRRQPVALEPRTYIPALGHDKGVPHHFFTEDEVRRLLKRFERLELRGGRSIELLARKYECAARDH